MNKLKIFKYTFLVLAMWGVSSCTQDFEKINSNPNAPTVDKAAPDQLLTSAIESMTNRVQSIDLGHEVGECWSQHMAKCQYTDEDRYIPRTTTMNNAFASFYAANGQDISLIYKIGVAQENESYQGVALVLKSYLISVLTDVFGDVPYSEAFKGDVSDGGISSPIYDTQESIYRDLIAKLDDANTLLQVGDEIAGDILFDGDLLMWQKFANSLRLRLLLRMSSQDAAFVTTEMTKMVATSPDNYPLLSRSFAYTYDPTETDPAHVNDGLGSAGEDVALIYLGSAPNNNPLNENRKTRDDHRVSKSFIDLLLTKYGDYRVFVFAQPSSGTDEFIGMPNGLTSAQAAAFNGNGLANTSKIGDYFVEATAPGMLISYSELQFILSEATKRGFITGAPQTAQKYYEEGVVACFEQYRDFLQGIFDANDGAAYDYGGQPISADYTVNAEINWALTGGAPWDDSYQLIAEQRYIATFGQGLQTWFEYRRTGFPILTPAAAGDINQIPSRLTYPLDEATLNPTNVATAIGRLSGGDLLTSKVWWDAN